MKKRTKVWIVFILLGWMVAIIFIVMGLWKAVSEIVIDFVNTSLISIERNWFDKSIWSTVIDDKTHDLCRDLDGKKFNCEKVDEIFANHLIDLGEDMTCCRCTTRGIDE